MVVNMGYAIRVMSFDKTGGLMVVFKNRVHLRGFLLFLRVL